MLYQPDLHHNPGPGSLIWRDNFKASNKDPNPVLNTSDLPSPLVINWLQLKLTDDEDLISFIMSGLNPSFNSFITSYSVTTREHSPTFANFQDHVLNHKMLLNQQSAAPADTNDNFAFYMHRQESSPSNFNHRPFQKNRSGLLF